MKEYSLISVFKQLHSWRKPVIYTTIGVAVLTAIISLLVPVFFRASTTFYAASQDLFMPRKVFGYSESDMMYYGTTDDIQRVLTIARSAELADEVISQFDLYTHYKVDTAGEKAQFKVREKFFDRYQVIRTKYDALELSVEDRDPDMAANIANAARDKINTLLSRIVKSSQKDVIDSYKSAISGKEATAREIYDSLSRYQIEYGIFDPENQTEYLSTLLTQVETMLTREKARLESFRGAGGQRDSVAYLTSVVAGLEEQRNMLLKPDTSDASNYSVARFNRGKGKVTALDNAYVKAINSVNNDKELLKQQESVYALEVPTLHIVEYAERPLVKHRPKRTLLVLTCTMAAFIMMCIGVLLIESYKHLDWTFLKKW